MVKNNKFNSFQKRKITKINKICLMILVISKSMILSAAPLCELNVPSSGHLSASFNNARSHSEVTKKILARYPQIPSGFGKSKIRLNSVCTQNDPSISTLLRLTAEKCAEKASTALPTPLFKFSCLRAINQFQPGRQESVCMPSDSLSRTENTHKLFTDTKEVKANKNQDNKCLSDQLIEYQNAVVSDVYTCLKEEAGLPLKPESILKIFALESGFNPNISYVGGTGVGQLTSIYIADLFQGWRGLPTLNKVFNSNNSACAASKELLKNDLSKKPPQPPSFSNKCSYMQYGDGFERNILFSVAGLITMWEKDIKKTISPYLEKCSFNPKFKDKCDLVRDSLIIQGYGSGGGKSARTIATRLTENLNPDQLLSAIGTPFQGVKSTGIDNTTYIKKLNQREKEVGQLFQQNQQDDIKKYNEKGLSSCVNN